MNLVVNLDLIDVIADDEVLEAELAFSRQDKGSIEKLESKYFIIEYEVATKEITYLKTKYNYKIAGILGKFNDQFVIHDITSREKLTLEELFETIFD